MIELIETNRDQIADLCRENDIVALWVFGSAAKGTWNPDTSDIDFLVDLGEYEPGVSGRFLRLMVALEELLERSIDLVTIRQLKSEWFRTEVLATRELIYAAKDSTMVA